MGKGWTQSHEISVQHFVNMEFQSPTCRWSIYPWIIKKISWYDMICKTDSKRCAPKCSERSAALPDKIRANEKNLRELLTKHRPRGHSNNCIFSIQKSGDFITTHIWNIMFPIQSKVCQTFSFGRLSNHKMISKSLRCELDPLELRFSAALAVSTQLALMNTLLETGW